MTDPEATVRGPRSRPLVGVSRCLMGDAVRYDGGSCHCRWITEVLSQHCDLLPFCPEIEAGLGVPRPPIRLVAEAGGVEVQLVDDPVETRTAELSAAVERLLAGMTGLDGLILKARSPSCGVSDTPLFGGTGAQVGLGAGYFTRRCQERWKSLVIVDEQLLASEAGRVSFMVQVLKRHHSSDD